MGRWLPKEEREERNRKVIELYWQGFTYEVICKRLGFSGKSGSVGAILAAHGVARNRTLSKEEVEKNYERALELYRQGVSHVEIRLACKVNISKVLKRHGLKADRRC